VEHAADFSGLFWLPDNHHHHLWGFSRRCLNSTEAFFIVIEFPQGHGLIGREHTAA
jgi:hypothetical protein